jgi:hypothetical protein
MNIVMLAAMMVILPLMQKQEQFESEFSLYLPHIFLIFFAALIAGQISSRLIPLEGKSFWITKLSPQPSSRILGEKFILGFTTSTVLAWIAVIIIGISFHHPLRLMVLAIAVSMSFSGVLSSMGLLIATRFARFDWDHPKLMLSSAGGLLLSLASLFIVGAIGGMIALIYIFGKSLGFSIQSLDILAGSFTIVLSSLLIFFFIMLGAKKLDKLEWQF